MSYNTQIIASNIPDYKTAELICRSLGDCWIIAPSGGICTEIQKETVDKFHMYHTVKMGNTVEYKRLSLSPYIHHGKTLYQVYSDFTGHKHNELYDDLDKAIDMYLEICNKVKNKGF